MHTLEATGDDSRAPCQSCGSPTLSSWFETQDSKDQATQSRTRRHDSNARHTELNHCICDSSHARGHSSLSLLSEVKELASTMTLTAEQALPTDASPCSSSIRTLGPTQQAWSRSLTLSLVLVPLHPQPNQAFSLAVSCPCPLPPTSPRTKENSGPNTHSLKCYIPGDFFLTNHTFPLVYSSWFFPSSLI